MHERGGKIGQCGLSMDFFMSYARGITMGVDSYIERGITVTEQKVVVL